MLLLSCTTCSNFLCFQVSLPLGDSILVLTLHCCMVQLDLSLISSLFPIWFVIFFLLLFQMLDDHDDCQQHFCLVRMKFQLNQVWLIIHHLYPSPCPLFFLKAIHAKHTLGASTMSSFLPSSLVKSPGDCEGKWHPMLPCRGEGAHLRVTTA